MGMTAGFCTARPALLLASAAGQGSVSAFSIAPTVGLSGPVWPGCRRLGQVQRDACVILTPRLCPARPG
jgi:hypothetical protein